MKNLINLYLGHLAAEDKSSDTIAQYGGALRRFELWLKREYALSLTEQQARKITGVMLTEYYQTLHGRALAVSTRNNYVIILKEFFEFLAHVAVIPNNPSAALRCIKAKKPQEEAEPHMYTAEQIEALLASIAGHKRKHNDLRDTAIIALILGSALRASELCSLNVAQMDEIRRGSLRCKRKGGSWKDVAVASFAVTHVERYLLMREKPQPNDPLFVSQKGNRLTRTALWKSLAAKQQEADLCTGVHIFRHTVLSAVDHDGGSALARDIGGHTSVAITNSYVHTTSEERRDAINNTVFSHIMA